MIKDLRLRNITIPPFVQSTPSTVWTINHNLGYHPDIILFDENGTEFNAAVSNPTLNQTVVTMKIATAGTAQLN